MSQIFVNNKRIAKNTLLLYDRMLFISKGSSAECQACSQVFLEIPKSRLKFVD